MKNEKNERGAVTIVEATFVFPMMFLIILFLIYMGNMYYMRSKLDGLAAEYAVRGAAECVDPLLKEISESGSVPTQINDVKPYHTLLGGNQASNARSALNKSLGKVGSGFFSGMGLRFYCVTKFQKDSNILGGTFTCCISYQIRFPIRLLGSKKPITLSMQSMSVASVTDTPEFIQNVDMVMDFLDQSGVSEKLGQIKEKVGKFLN